MLARMLSAAKAVEPAYIEDVFSTYLYTGNGGTQTITNGIDLAGKGGLVWLKQRDAGVAHFLFDTARGEDNALSTNSTSGNGTGYDAYFNFLSTGFSFPTTWSQFNANGSTFASWTFRKQPKFFDVVTYTGNGSNRTISHGLGSVPGVIIVKRTDTAADWQVYHRSIASTEYMVLNSTAAKATGATRWDSTTPTATQFILGTDTTVNANGGTYVAYLFAHDAGGFGASGSDNVITCGSYTGNGSATGPTVTLGYEPQWLLIKRADSADSWYLFDVMRGLALTGNNPALFAELSSAEVGVDRMQPLSTGFTTRSAAASVNASGGTYIYIAIRRGPMKTPTSGTSVFSPVVYTGTNADNRLVDMSLLTDMAFVRQRDDTSLGGMVVGDRLRGDPYLLTGTTAAEVNDADSFMTPTSGVGNSWSAMNGFGVGNDATSKLNASTTSNNQIAEGFRRAPGFFDVVCYTGDSVNNRQLPHNLGVVPELVIHKSRNTGTIWYVWSAGVSPSNKCLILNLNYAASSGYDTGFQSSTATNLNLSTNSGEINISTQTYVAYLFASCSGVSKVGSYTGTGTTLQVDCGFTGGARFVLIKRTDSTGDWYVWDSARGIVAGNDPYLLLNSTAAEVTTTDYIDTYSLGFEISSTAPAAINANGGTFIFLAVA